MVANSESGARGGSPEFVELDLPLQHRHASTVRVVAASLGADAGLTVDEIEDLRLGVNEAVSVLADVDAVDGARLRVRFEIVGEGMTVTARRSGVDQELSIDVQLARVGIQHVAGDVGDRHGNLLGGGL